MTRRIRHHWLGGTALCVLAIASPGRADILCRTPDGRTYAGDSPPPGCVVTAPSAAATGASAGAGEGPAALFVLDASGSMMGKVEGKPKIDVARSVMGEVMKSLDPAVRTGLIAYGHRSKDDCKDIEVVAPVGAERAALVQAVNGLQAKGKTPLTESIRLAVSQFREYEGAASVVLVTDGLETCEGDPCAAAREAIASGVKLRIHVVGFDLKPEEAAQLQCIAKEGKGKYFSASNATGLSHALAEVQKEVVAQQAAPTTPVPQAQAPAPKSNILPRGGHGLADAIALEPNDYEMNWDLKANVHEYWFFQAKPGQLVRAVLRPAVSSYTGGVLYGDDQSERVKEGCTNSVATLPWVTSREKNNKFYLSVGGCNGVANGSGVKITMEDVFDGGSGSDAGADFDGALKISPGTYKGNLAGQWGDDEKDLFALPLKGGQTLAVKATPASDGRLHVAILDQDRAEVGDKRSANPGAIARVSWTAGEDQEAAYIAVERECNHCKLELVTYQIEVQIKSRSGEEPAAQE
jgi:von Willebrand factor type A domain